MKTTLKLALITTSLIVSSMAFAQNEHHPAQDSQEMKKGSEHSQGMMMQHMDKMKSELKLSADQEKLFDTFTQNKKNMMKGMMGHKKGMTDHKGNMKNGQSGEMKGMNMMADMNFEQHMNKMKSNAENMLSTSEAGLNFYNTLNTDQKEKINAMPAKMKEMKMKGMDMNGMK
jgi:LTXXQ motif family protein